MKVRQAAFALRVVRRRAGDAAILYRRTLNGHQEERLTRVASISPLAYSSAAALLRTAVRATGGNGAKLTSGPFHPLDMDWGARVACYTLLALGLRNAERLHKAAENIRQSDGAEAAWWFGLMGRPTGKRAVRAFRILTEAVR
jgi:acetylornithine deacetylase/succinyl-diaminopimelate desuccinylase-like protein